MATRTALSCSFIDVNNAVNGGGPFVGPAPDGSTVIVPAGKQSWTQTLVIQKGITLQGQTTVDNAGFIDSGIVLNADANQTIIQDDSPRNTNPYNGLMYISVLASQVSLANPFRLTGFTFLPGVSAPSTNNNGMIRLNCNVDNVAVYYTRIDHCYFNVAGKSIETNGWTYGCIDHNYFLIRGNGQPLNVNNAHHGGGIYSNGDGSWSDYPWFGTDKFIFFETNTVVGSGTSQTSGSNDGDAGGRLVARYNYCKQGHLIGGHGTEGINRSMRCREGYNNTTVWPGTLGPGGTLPMRGGAVLVHDEIWTAPAGSSLGMGITIYRENAGVGANSQFGFADGATPWDKNATEADGTFIDGHSPHLFASGTVTAVTANSGTSITITDNTQSWSPVNKWVGYSIRQSTSSAASYPKASYITASTATTITFARYASTDRGPLLYFDVGNAYQVHKVLVALDQAGAGKCDPIDRTSAGLPKLVSTGAVGYPHSASEPCYAWNNVANGSTEMLWGDGGLPTVLTGRPGVGRDAIDIGLNKVGTPTEVSTKYVAALNGVDYTGPYTYPHPLTGTTIPTITSVANYSPTAGVGGTFQMTSTGFSSSPTYSKTGSLPSGTSLSSGGLLTVGSGSAAGDYPITVTATHLSEVDTQDFVLHILASATKIISLTGSGLAFGNVDINTTGAGSVTINNTGNTVLTVTSITLPSGYSADWTSGTVDPGANHKVNITFAPVAATTYNGTITVVSDKTSGTNTIVVTGLGATKIIGLSGSLAFGSITDGQTATRTLTVTNTGNIALLVNSVTYPEGFSGDYSSGSIAAGGTVLVHVTFSPLLAQAYSGDVVFATNKTGGTSTVAATGTGTAAATKIVQLTGSLAFGSVETSTTLTKALSIKNSGNSTLTVTDLTLPTGYDSDWTSGTIAAGATQVANITFSPVSVTSYNGDATVVSDATGGVDTTAVTGAGTASSTKIIALSGNMVFGNVTVNTTVTRTLTITNSGTAALTVTSITYPTGFTGSYSGTIDPGASHDVDVVFSPILVQGYSGTITVNSDKTSGTNTIAASGAGVVPSTKVIALSGDLSFGAVQKKHTSQRSFVISNTGTALLTVTNITCPTGFTTDITSASIPAGASQAVVVTFAPVNALGYGGVITVTSDKTAGPNTIICSGAGKNSRQVPFILIVG